MIEIAAAAAAISTISSTVKLIDQMYDSYMKYRSSGEIDTPKETEEKHYEEIEASKDNNALVHKVGGTEFRRVTREDLSKLLSSEDLEFIEVCEKRLRNLEAQWKAISLEIDLADALNRARMESQIKLIAEKMGGCLKAILDFLEKIGFDLHDHYGRIRVIAGMA